MIISTLEDIKDFLYVLVSLCLMFMNGFYMIQLNRMETGKTQTKQVFAESDPDNGTLYAGGIIHQYFLLLGDFNTGGLWR